MIRLVAQVLPGGVHQFEGVADVVAGEPAVTLDDVAADDHRLNVGRTRSENLMATGSPNPSRCGDRMSIPRYRPVLPE